MSEMETGGSPARGEARRRRWVRGAWWAGAILLLYSVTGFFLVPRIIRWAIQRKGSEALHRRVTLSEVSFNPFTLRARLRDLQVRDRDARPFAAVGGIDLRLGLSGIFRRAWRLRELTIDRPSLHVRFLRDGKLSFTDMLSSGGNASTPRLIVDQLAIRGGSLEVSDESVTPRFVTTFAPLNAEVRDLITIPGERGEHQLSIGFGKHSSIRIAGRQTLEPLGLSGRIEIKGIDLVPLAQRLAEGAPIQLRGGEADVALDYDLRKEANGVQLRVSHGELNAGGLSLSRAGTDEELLAVPNVEIRDVTVAYPARQANIGSIRIMEPRATIAFDSQGRFNWAGETNAAGTGAKPAPGVPWKISAGKVGIENGALHFDDRRSSAPVAFDLTAVTIGLDAVTSVTSARIAFTATAAESGDGRISLRGTLVPSPFAIDSQVALSALDLAPVRPWASIPGLTLNSGLLGFDGRLGMNSRQPYLIEGNGELKGLVFVDSSNNPLLACKTATVRRARFDGANSRFQIRGLDLDGMYANVVIDKQRNLNLSSIGASSAPASSAATSASVAVASSPGAAPPKSPEQKGSFDIGTIRIVNGTIDYRDDSLALPFDTTISSTRGTVTDFSTTSAAAGTIRLAGDVADHGSMTAEGTMRMAEPFAGTDLVVHFRNVPMPVLTPYSAEFAGYAIERGSLDLDIHYRIADRRLQGDHRVVATDLTLGQRVGGSRAGFAVRLAVALLKDHNGKIDLQVPIEGSVDSPEFNYRAVLWQALKTIMGNIVKAPFRALGRAMGLGGAENLQLVSFDPGESTIAAAEAETLHKIAAELAARPELELQIEGRYDRELDTAAMKQARLESLIASRREAVKNGEAISLESILEGLYTEAFSAERLAAERAKFTSHPPAPPARKGRAAVPQPEIFDANGFYDALRAELLAAQSVTANDLHELARTRAQAVAAALTGGGTLPAERVKELDPAEARRRPGSQQVDAEMKLTAVRSEATTKGTSR